jgi:putative PIN family toxin of toxin-antitoxin system
LTVVLDSNVWISALQFGGVALVALRSAFIYDRIACCDEIGIEVSKVLVARFGWAPQNPVAAMKKYSDAMFDVRITGALEGICRDPKDDMVLECALIGGAELIVSGDKDLLTLKAYSGISIITPRAYLDLFADPQSRL